MEKNDPFEKNSNLAKYLLLQLDVNRDKSEYVETRRRSGGGDLSDGKSTRMPAPSALRRQMSVPNLKVNQVNKISESTHNVAVSGTTNGSDSKINEL